MLPITDLDPSEATSYEQEYLLEPSPEAILDQLLCRKLNLWGDH